MVRILIIEDEDAVRENLVELLQAEGYACLDAADGEEGIRKAWEAGPDLILCDILMPGLDGFAVWATLRNDPATATIPFIYLTAKIERADQRRGMDLGADDYITKPFTREELLRAIRTRLEKHQVLTLQAQKKLANLRSNLSQSLPHELLAPLSVILSYSEVLAENPPSANWNQAVAMVRDIHGSARKLLRSIQNYLLLVEIDQQGLGVGQVASLQGGILTAAERSIGEIAEMKALEAGRKADLKLDIEKAEVRISEIYLEKIVEELLDNAFQYSPAGSPVELTAHLDSRGGMLDLRIADHGRGIEAEQLVEITTYRELNSKAYDARGMSPGMGLLLVRRLVELHGGFFQIESVPGKGTAVTVGLPASRLPGGKS